MNRWLILGLLLAVALALALRVPQLGRRPMHNDEAVNAVKFGQLWTQGTYKYDPDEHHGPSLPYATLAGGRVSGAQDILHFSDARLRWIPLVFGVGLVLLLPLVVDGLGRRGMLWAAGFTVISPAMVYYSRYYIHEMLLVWATFLALGAGWRYWRTRKIGWALLAGAGLGLMHATKETFVITLAVAALALMLNLVWNRWLDASPLPRKAPPLNPIHLAAGLGVWLAVALVLFSSFFSNAAGPLDSVRTYLPWLNRAGGDSPHIHPWSFYLRRLLWFHTAKGPIWSEGIIFVLALIGAGAGFVRQRLGRGNASFLRFLALYAFGLLAAYSLVPYKTPWCLLSFWHGMILLAGVGAVVLLRKIGHKVWRGAAALVILACAGQLTWQAWRASFPAAADPSNPYVYAHTSPDLLRLVNQVEMLSEAHPEGHRLLLKVICPDSDYWPLPWYLRAFERIGWWSALPADPYASIMVVSAGLQARLDEKKTHLMIGYFQLRPGVFLELYVELDLWKAYLAKHPPKPDEP